MLGGDEASLKLVLTALPNSSNSPPVATYTTPKFITTNCGFRANSFPLIQAKLRRDATENGATSEEGFKNDGGDYTSKCWKCLRAYATTSNTRFIAREVDGLKRNCRLHPSFSAPNSRSNDVQDIRSRSQGIGRVFDCEYGAIDMLLNSPRMGAPL